MQGLLTGLFESLKMIAAVFGVLLAAAYLAHMDQKILAKTQLRQGPNRTGLWGIFQPFAHMIKLFSKGTTVGRDRLLFVLAPGFTLLLALGTWAVIPLDRGRVIEDLDVGILYVLFLFSLAIYGAIIGGWATGSKYGLLGSLRAGAQQISYQLILGLIFVAIVLCTGSLNLTKIVEAQTSCWLVLPLFPLFCIFILCALAEATRGPFDGPRSSEIRGGYEGAYSGVSFWFYMLSEYVILLTFGALATLLFLGGWLPILSTLPPIPGLVWFLTKMILILFAFAWIKATVPQVPQDQFMVYSWKIFLPFTVGWIILVAVVKLISNI